MLSYLALFLAILQPTVAKGNDTAAQALKADQVVDKVQAYYTSIKKLRADFRQEYTNVTFGKKSRSDGKVYISSPGKMRWDYEKPDKKYFISDGTTLWVYEPNNKQAFQQNLADTVLPAAITFLYGQGNLKQEFNAELDAGKYGAKGDYVLKLTPKQASAQYKHLWLVVDPIDFHVKESVILEANNNLNHFKFANVKLNEKAKFQEKHFKFVPPEGVKVIQPQKQGAAGSSGAP